MASFASPRFEVDAFSSSRTSLETRIEIICVRYGSLYVPSGTNESNVRWTPETLYLWHLWKKKSAFTRFFEFLKDDVITSHIRVLRFYEMHFFGVTTRHKRNLFIVAMDSYSCFHFYIDYSFSSLLSFFLFSFFLNGYIIRLYIHVVTILLSIERRD